MARPQVTLDDDTMDRIDELVKLTAHLDFNQVLRDIINRGINSLEHEVFSSHNKRLVQRKLKQRQASMDNAIAVVARIAETIPLPNEQHDELAAAVKALQKGVN